MDEPAMARTSWGRRAMLNDSEIIMALAKIFSMVWWRDLTVIKLTMEVAAVSNVVSTSTRTEKKSNEQPEGGCSPNEMRMSWGPLSKMEERTGRLNTYLDCSDMGSLILLNNRDP